MLFSVTPGVCASAEVIATVIVNSNDKAARGKNRQALPQNVSSADSLLPSMFPAPGYTLLRFQIIMCVRSVWPLCHARARVTKTRDSRKWPRKELTIDGWRRIARQNESFLCSGSARADDDLCFQFRLEGMTAENPVSASRSSANTDQSTVLVHEEYSSMPRLLMSQKVSGRR